MALNAPLYLNAMVNPIGDVTGAACEFFEAVAKLSYPVVAEIFLSVKFVFAGLCLVCNSDQTPCFCTIGKDPLNDGNEDVVLVVHNQEHIRRGDCAEGGSSSSAMMHHTGNNN